LSYFEYRFLGIVTLLGSAFASVGCSGDAALARDDGAATNDGSAGTMSSGSGGDQSSGGAGTRAMVMTTGGGGSGAVGGDAGSEMVMPSVWHGAKSARATDAMLQQEYTTWKMRNVQQCSNGSAAVKRDAGSVVSEGIGYGMLLSVAFQDRTLFDALFRYYNDHLDKNGLMNWAAGLPNGQCDPPGDNMANAATDGDLDTTMALVQADAAWPNSGYLAKAQTLAANILAHEVVDCPGPANAGTIATLKPGDAWGACTDKNNDKRINPSYFAPGYYRVFAARFADQAARWNALVDGTYKLYPVLQSGMKGLVPDWTNSQVSDLYGGSYGYDACRTPWRVAVDYAWSGDDNAKTFLQGVSAWVDGHGGLPQASQQNNSAFIGSFALTGIYDQTKLDGYVASWLGAMTDDVPYYQGTLRLLYLLVAAGRFPSTI
jgi:endo-1,4-beta-D-glucanase Y